jgi:phage baseplate assembly protein W
MTLISEIKTKDWSLSMERQGEVVQELTDINQCIYIILTTVPGTDPLRPTFGAGVHSYVDRPVNIALPNMVREAAKAIALWEPRVIVTKVTPRLEGDSNIILKVEWKTLTSSLVNTTEIKYGT